jgi:PPP family 3-phenylpropionic acid transporter
MGRRTYWSLATYYFFHFTVAGGFYPYLAPYLLRHGLNAAQVGELLAAVTATKLIAPYCWAWLADHHHAHLQVVRATSFVGVVCFSGFLLEPGVAGLFVVLMLYSFFWNGTLPQFEALTLAHLGTEKHRYTRVRLWGSIGYIVTVAGFGAYFGDRPIDDLPVMTLLLLVGASAASWWVPPVKRTTVEPVDGTRADALGDASDAVSGITPGGITPGGTTSRGAISGNGLSVAGARAGSGVAKRLLQPPVIAFLVCALLMQMSHGVYYGFYTVYLDAQGYSSASIGGLWALGVVSEIALFLVMDRVLKRYPLKALAVACFILTGARWLLLAYLASSPGAVVFAQLLHAVSYGAFHAISMLLIGRYFSDMQGRGQAIYAAFSFGLGGILGNLSAGYVWSWAGPSAAFVLAAVVSFVAGIIAARWVR